VEEADQRGNAVAHVHLENLCVRVCAFAKNYYHCQILHQKNFKKHSTYGCYIQLKKKVLFLDAKAALWILHGISSFVVLVLLGIILLLTVTAYNLTTLPHRVKVSWNTNRKLYLASQMLLR